ncbi:hypothetical protein SRHO_G00208800 [Serrasalmus rhombeus]
MSYSRRVASWLFSLPARLVQACARGAKLEMISVWLLFLKLLRATAGVKRPNGSETNEGRKDSLNQQQKEQEYLSEAVTMETSQLSEMVDLKDYKMDLGDTEEDKCQRSEEDGRDERDCFDAHFPECLDTQKTNSSITDEHNSNEVANDCVSFAETDRSADLQDNIMVKETEKEESNLRESTPSPEPDVDHQAQDQPVEGEDDNPPTLDANGTEHQDLQESLTIGQEDNTSTCDTNGTEHQEPLDNQKTEQEDYDSLNVDANVEEPQEPQDSPKIEQEDHSPSDFDTNVAEHQEPHENPKVEQEDDTQSPFDASGSEHQEPQGSLKTEQENNLSAFDGTELHELQGSPKIEQESVLEQQIKELAISDASTESCHDNDQDDLSDCLQVEMAIVSSDSDAEEQWKSMVSPAVENENDSGGILGSDPPDLGEEPNNQEDVIEDNSSILLESNAIPVHELLEETTGCTDILEQPECPTECELEDLSYEGSIHYRSLTKIPEDEEDLNQNAKHSLQRLSASTSELDKKLPQDYCVIEEAKSENVSTEHLDFRMARQQWKKMEEQNKGQSRQPNIKQGACQGGHSFMYTPVRTLERPKKDQDSDSLSLGDYQYTQFSPCSEDSGLDDTSYRSPYDEPETPVEREIRETMEREESFKRERALSRSSSGEPVESKPRPTTLLASRSDPDDRRRLFNTPEDRCRSQRSPSTRTPTLSITASPSSKPAYHEMVANNVIILEPDSYSASPRHKGKGLLSPGTSSFHEWPSDMSNVIILETSNLIIRSASEFCLSTACQETQESTFHNNPFFKLRSHSTQSLVDQEIKVVRQRDEEFRRQRAQLYTKEKYDTVLVSPSLLESFTYDRPGEIPSKCKSSPSSPSKIRKMDRSVLSCDQKFPEAPFTRVRRKSALVQRWEAGIFANHQKD